MRVAGHHDFGCPCDDCVAVREEMATLINRLTDQFNRMVRMLDERGLYEPERPSLTLVPSPED